MKIRTDFVTNSSSSSFVLAFKDDVDYKEFKNCCKDNRYNDFGKLIDDTMKRKPIHGFTEHEVNTHKQAALNFIEHYYTYDYKQKLIEEKVDRSKYNNFADIIKAEKEVTDSAEYKEKMEQFMKQNEEYQEKKKKIEESSRVVFCEIWDSYGGLLEWAIRNDFIKQEFREWLICQLDIG